MLSLGKPDQPLTLNLPLESFVLTVAEKDVRSAHSSNETEAEAVIFPGCVWESSARSCMSDLIDSEICQ